MKKLTDIDTWKNEIKSIQIFQYLTEVELKKLMTMLSIIEFSANEKIVVEGEIDRKIYGVLEGTVSVSVQEKDSPAVFICALGTGEVFGEAGFFLKIKRTASVIAQDTVTVLQLSRDDLTTFIREFPSAGNKILLITIYGLLKKLRMANQELAYERKSDYNQSDIDDLVNGLLVPD